MILRGEVYWVDFRGGVGAEIRKVRPAVVLSDENHNAKMATVTVAPLSSAEGRVKLYETVVPAGSFGDGRAARVKTHQLRAVDRSRLGKKMGALSVRTMLAVGGALRIHLGL